MFDDVTRDNDLAFGDDDDGGGGFEGNDCDGGFMDDDHFNTELDGVRKVERIEVGYATTSTKVDIKKLKNDLWAELQCHRSVNPENPEELDGTFEGDTGSPVSFKGTQDKLNLMQKQADASTAYYFICVLHLANEKGLRLEGREDLLDFTIAKDGCGGA